jgi:hypothetical protein
MEAAIENIVSLAVVGNLTINQLMEHEAAVADIAKAAFVEEPKWTIAMANNMHSMASQVVETLVNTFKQEECKLN